MAILGRLKEFLDKNQVKYEASSHPESYTAQEIAATLHVPGKHLAKVVMVKGGDRFFMTALPASFRINMERLKDILKEKTVRLATEEEFRNLFPDCEVGAMPPFGKLYDMETYVDRSLAEGEWFVFQAGTHVDTIKMKYDDFSRLVSPKVEEFAVHL